MISVPTNSTSPIDLFSLSFGGGIIDIAALTTLLGSAAAESLILGSHGPAGVSWATMSAFGLVWVIRACLGAASPGWLRETMGLRTPVSDAAVGMELSSDTVSRAAARIRRHNGVNGPLALVIEPKVDDDDEKDGKRWSNRIQSWKEVYGFSLQTMILLSGIPDTGVGSSHNVATYATHTNDVNPHTSLPAVRKTSLTPTTTESEQGSLSVYTYLPFKFYPFYRPHNPRFHISVLALSTIKLAECFTLRAFGGSLLGIITALPWAYFLGVALFLEARELSLARRPEEPDGHVDILAGQIPLVSRSGGARRIVIGAHHNPRTSVWWQIIWGIGAVVCTSSLSVTYMLMGSQTSNVVFIWATFQATWMLARMSVYHFAEPMDVVARRVLVERPWDSLPSSIKARVLELVIVCAQYQTQLHARQPPLYNGDSFTSSQLASVLVDTPSMRHYPLTLSTDADGHHSSVAVNVRAVIGDTVLASAAWVSGLNRLTPEDLYDCCIVALSDDSSPGQVVAVPAVRFFSGAPTAVPGAEWDVETSHVPEFIPKGAHNNGTGTWWYYVPCDNGLWLLMKKETPNTIIGKQNAEIVDEAQITATLAPGNMNISLSHVDEVKHTAELSETARQVLLRLLVG